MDCPLKILLLGSGGREHALAWKLVQSPLCEQIFIAPGNPGTETLGTNLLLDPTDPHSVLKACYTHNIDLVISGPEAPLIKGVSDRLIEAGIRVVGPTQAGAQLESSKVFAKQISAVAGVPTPVYKHFTDLDSALAYVLDLQEGRYVIKRDDPALGKGVALVETQDDGQRFLYHFFAQQRALYGDQSLPGMLIEERFFGDEISFFAVCNGTQALSLGGVRDYKRLRAGDKGSNTGGMGAYSSLSFLTPALEQTIMDTFIIPILKALSDHGTPYRGILYAGLMRTKKGLVLLEYNVRFGDPEAQVLMVRLSSDLVPLLLWSSGESIMKPSPPIWRDEAAVGVVLAAKNYPDAAAAPPSSFPIQGLEDIKGPHIHIFHGSTTRDPHGLLHAVGGRVVTVVGLGATVEESQMRAYSALEHISWPDGYYRDDIGGSIPSFKDNSILRVEGVLNGLKA